jgi:hypothetical protein
MQPTDIKAWHENIAKKSKLDIEAVRDVLSHFSIEPIVKSAIPQRLRITSLAFTGEKHGTLSGPIQFDWRDLAPGVHAIVSADNFMGKTTIMKLMKLGLSGGSGPQKDMEEWFKTLTLRFALDDDIFETRLDDFANRRGSLVNIKGDRDRMVATFDGADAFGNAMETFFLDRLGLNLTKMVVNKGGKEVVQEHGWPWLASIMSIDPDPTDVFGGIPGVTLGGMPSYLMRMFVGLPWVGTYTDIKAALKGIDMEKTKVDQSTTRSQANARARMAELNKQRADLQDKLAGPSDLDVFSTREKAGMSQLSDMSQGIQALIATRAEITDNLSAAEETLTHARRTTFSFDDAQQAGTVFRLLRPEHCPSCDEVFTDDYREEKQRHHDCIVCGRKEKEDADEEAAAEYRRQLETAEEDAKGAVRKLRASVKKTSDALENKMLERDKLEAGLRDVQAEMRAAQSTASIWREALKLDAQIEEVSRLVEVEPERADPAKTVLLAAEAVTHALFSDSQKEIFAEVADLATAYARTFGIKTLESLKFSGARLQVFKSGGSPFFGDCTPGERTRLKIACNMAMIQVAERRGVGRHPGLLFIDSPGAAEAKEENVAQIIEGLGGLSAVLPEVQVFFTCIDNNAILAHVPCENVRKARADGYMW